MPSEWTSDVLPWAAPALTLVGWWLVNRQTNVRELRKDARSAADQCKKLAIAAAKVGANYWLGKPDVSAWEVKAALEEVETEVKRFPPSKGRQVLADKLIRLMEAIMADDFDSHKMQVRQPHTQIFRNIARARQAFLHAVEDQFETHYL